VERRARGGVFSRPSSRSCGEPLGEWIAQEWAGRSPSIRWARPDGAAQHRMDASSCAGVATGLRPHRDPKWGFHHGPAVPRGAPRERASKWGHAALLGRRRRGRPSNHCAALDRSRALPAEGRRARFAANTALVFLNSRGRATAPASLKTPSLPTFNATSINTVSDPPRRPSSRSSRCCRRSSARSGEGKKMVDYLA